MQIQFSGSLGKTKFVEGVQEGSIIVLNGDEYTVTSLLGDQVILTGKDRLGNKNEIMVSIDRLIDLQMFRKSWQGISPTQRLN